jgi:hypothetical protein
MNTKHCNTCGTVKPASDFGLRAASSDGLAAKCKECQKAYDKNRAKDPHRAQARKAYRQTERGKLVVREISRRYYASNPKKRKARMAVGNALRDGKLFRQPCEVCGNPTTEAHHEDYSQPLVVRWLCNTHHRQRHAEMRQKGISP